VKTSASVLLSRLMGRARLKHLQVLVAVAELGSLRKAAEAVSLTQPAVTHVIADLELLLETRLFERHSRGATPTHPCRELVRVARRMTDALGGGLEDFVAQRDHARGSVRIGATAAALAGLLVEATPAFNALHPDVPLHVTEGLPDTLFDALHRSEIDLVACRQPGLLPEGWSFRPCVDDRLVVACGPAHPLAGRKQVRWEQLARHDWLAAPVSTLGRRVLDEQLHRRGLAPRYVQVSTIAVAMTISMLTRKPLLTLIPYGVVKPFVHSGTLAVLPVADLPHLPPLGLLTSQPSLRQEVALLSDFVAAGQLT
jgi:DNA-binding transcriptional LysR family regulator